LGGLEAVEFEHLYILSDGKNQVGKERLVGLRDKSLAAFDGGTEGDRREVSLSVKSSIVMS
jgi:hypothetical protein